jgi:hypothetical protein
MSKAQKAYKGKMQKKQKARTTKKKGLNQHAAIAIVIAVLVIAWGIMMATGFVPSQNS